MIIKTIGHKNDSQRSMKKLVDYIFDLEKMQDKVYNREPLVVKQHLQGYDQSKYGEQFKSNDQKRDYNNIKRVTLRHEIISFDHNDDQKLTREKLKKIAKEYINRRSPNSLCVAVAHYDENPHIHIIVSGVANRKSTRLTRHEFKEFKKGMEAWQREQFPELVSKIEHEQAHSVKLKRTLKEDHMKKRGVKSEKEILSDKIKELTSSCKNLSEVKTILQNEKIETYERKDGDVITGVYLGARKFRLTTLGISKTRYRALTLGEKRFQELQELKKRRDFGKKRER